MLIRKIFLPAVKWHKDFWATDKPRTTPLGLELELGRFLAWVQFPVNLATAEYTDKIKLLLLIGKVTLWQIQLSQCQLYHLDSSSAWDRLLSQGRSRKMVLTQSPVLLNIHMPRHRLSAQCTYASSCFLKDVQENIFYKKALNLEAGKMAQHFKSTSYSYRGLGLCCQNPHQVAHISFRELDALWPSQAPELMECMSIHTVKHTRAQFLKSLKTQSYKYFKSDAFKRKCKEVKGREKMRRLHQKRQGTGTHTSHRLSLGSKHSPVGLYS